MDKKLALETIKNDILEGLKKAKSIMFATDEQVEEVKEELSEEISGGSVSEEEATPTEESPVVEEEMSNTLEFKVGELEKSIGDIYQMIKEMQNLQIKTSEKVIEFSTKPVKDIKGQKKELTPLEKQMEYIRSLQESMK